MKRLWKGISSSGVKCSIQILPEETRTIISRYYAVRVQHGDYIGDKLFSELLGFWLGAADVFNKALADK